MRMTFGTAQAAAKDGYVSVVMTGDPVSLPTLDQTIQAGARVVVLLEGGSGVVLGALQDFKGEDKPNDSIVAKTTKMAQAAQDTAGEALSKAVATENHFWPDTEGAHVSTTAGSSTGLNTLISSEGFQVRDGTTALAKLGAQELLLGLAPTMDDDSVVSLAGGAGELRARWEAASAYSMSVSSRVVSVLGHAGGAATIGIPGGFFSIYRDDTGDGSHYATLNVDGDIVLSCNSGTGVLADFVCFRGIVDGWHLARYASGWQRAVARIPYTLTFPSSAPPVYWSAAVSVDVSALGFAADAVIPSPAMEAPGALMGASVNTRTTSDGALTAFTFFPHRLASSSTVNCFANIVVEGMGV